LCFQEVQKEISLVFEKTPCYKKVGDGVPPHYPGFLMHNVYGKSGSTARTGLMTPTWENDFQFLVGVFFMPDPGPYACR
jgi:hypothetical protein